MYLPNRNKKLRQKGKNKFVQENFGLYGCERMSNFFEKNGQYYRLFITMPYGESEVAYLGIENYTGKLTESESEVVNTDQLDALDDLLK